jgi:hypothetical protein
VVLFPGDEVLAQCADLSVVVEELEVGEEHSVRPQLRPHLAPLTPPLHLAGLSKYDRKNIDSDSDIACSPSYQRISCRERRVSTTASHSRKYLISIGLDPLF